MEKFQPVLRAVWLLLLGLWIGADLGTGLFAAPAIFSFTESGVITSDIAGTIAGKIFASQLRFALVVVPVLVASMLFLLTQESRSRAGRLALAAMILCLVLVLAEYLYITPQIHALRTQLGEQFGSVAEAPKGDPLRRQFGMLHGVSMLRALAEVILGACAFVLTAARRAA